MITGQIKRGGSLTGSVKQSGSLAPEIFWVTYGSGGTSRGVITNNTPVCGYITLQAIVE